MPKSISFHMQECSTYFLNMVLIFCLKGRLHDRAKMAQIRQKLERFQRFLQRNRELLSVPQRVHRRLWTPNGTNKSSLFLCKNYWNRSSFCRIRAIFSLSCKRPFSMSIRCSFFMLRMRCSSYGSVILSSMSQCVSGRNECHLRIFQTKDIVNFPLQCIEF